MQINILQGLGAWTSMKNKDSKGKPYIFGFSVCKSSNAFLPTLGSASTSNLIKRFSKKFNSLVEIHGWDTKQKVVNSYRGKNQLIKVKRGDGFDGVSSLREPYEKLVFCDPFWREPQRPKDPKPDDVKGWLQTLDKGEPNELANYLNRLETFLRDKQDLEKTMDSVRALLGEQDHVILWYKRFPGQKLFFKNEEFKYCFKIDWEFKHYVGKKFPWIKNLKGAGLIIKGIEEEFCVKAYEKIRELETVFNGETWPNNPETAEIKLDLKVEFSSRSGDDDWIKHPRP